MTNRTDYNSITIKCFQSNDKILGRSPIKYHYTNLNSIISILTSRNSSEQDVGNLRFTDVRYLNDKSEKFYFIRALFLFLEKNKSKYPFCKLVVDELLLNKNYSEDDYINYRVNKIEYKPSVGFLPLSDTRQFVFCMSDNPDSLNMWNYYVKNSEYQGYNLGLDVNKIVKSFDTDKDSIDPIFMYFGKVLYSETEQNKEIENILNFIESLKNDRDRKYALQNGVNKLYRYILSYGLFFKDNNFSSENEYRMIIEISTNILKNDRSTYFNKNNRRILLTFFERKGILVPCLTVPLEKKSLKKITIAPNVEFEIAKDSLEEFLSVNGYNDVEITQSNIPIRF